MRKDARRVQKGRLGFASLMGVEGVASLLGAPRGPRVAPCSAKHMVVENDASLLGVLRVQRGRGVHHCAKLMVGVDVACSMGVGFAQRVFMVGRTSVWLMVGGSGARSRTVGKAPKEALSSAKLIEVGRDAIGVMESVRNLQGGEAGNVQPTTWLRSVNTSSKA